MKNLYPVGIQSFEEIRKGGYIYIDKTDIIYKLVKTNKYYFLSRPRRFGKSLLISTLEAYFEGKKELFKELAMEKLEKNWTEYPVLHLDLNNQKYDSPERLYNILNDTLCQWEDIYGNNEREKDLSIRFSGIIRRAAEKSGRNVVILIDEYDKPILQAIGNEGLITEYRNTLKAFSCDRYIRFALLTGVTKFSKVSVFSDLNNLMDISLSNRFADICGITEKELYTNFKDDIAELAEKNNLSADEAYRQLKEWYDGYHFVEDGNDIYNPFSILNTFAEMKFGNYWFETGTPTFLVELLKHVKYNLHRNKEVEEGFTRFLLPYYASLESGNPSFEIISFVQDVRNGEIDSFMLRLQSFFTDIPYVIVRELELHYQNVLFIVFKLLGFYTQVEYMTSNGRIDMIVKTDKYIYIMEFKLNGSAEDAIKQINEKGYASPFSSDSRTLIKVGVNFNNEIKGIEKWIVE